MNLDWGHELEIPLPSRHFGVPNWNVIRLPNWAMRQLRKCGLLYRNRNRLRREVTRFDHEERVALLGPNASRRCGGNLRLVLGPDFSGPAMIQCQCQTCRDKSADVYEAMPSADSVVLETSALISEIKRRRKYQ